MKNDYFSIQEIVDHLTQEAIRADAQMQLQQTYLWQEQIEGKMLFDSESHLKFLGLDELNYSVRLKKKRVCRWFLKILNRTDKGEKYKISPRGKIELVVRISRSRQNNFVGEAQLNEPSS